MNSQETIYKILARQNIAYNQFVVSLDNYNNFIFHDDLEICFKNHNHFLDVDKNFSLDIGMIPNLIFKTHKLKNITSKYIEIKEHLSIKECDVLQNLDMYNIHLHNTCRSRIIISECESLENIKNIRTANKIDVFISECKKLSNISFIERNTNVNCLYIDNTSLSDFGNLVNGSIMDLNIANSKINKFTKHNAAFIKFADISCSSIKSFIGIENFVVHHKFVLRHIKYPTNIINILLHNALDIIIQNDSDVFKLSVIICVLRKYVHYANRKEYVMDCALDLISHGYEEAAEL